MSGVITHNSVKKRSLYINIVVFNIFQTTFKNTFIQYVFSNMML